MRSLADSFFISSSNGRERIQFDVVTWDTESWMLRLSAKTKAWDRLAHTSEAQLVNDAAFTFHQIVVRYRNILQLSSLIDDWIENQTQFTVALGENAQRCEIEVSQTPELITSFEKPAFNVCYETSKVKLRSQMVVDQSCMRELQESLSGCLKCRV